MDRALYALAISPCIKKLGTQPTVQTSYLASERYQTLATNIESVNFK